MFILEKLGILHLYQRVISSFIHGLVRYCDLHNRKKLKRIFNILLYRHPLPTAFSGRTQTFIPGSRFAVNSTSHRSVRTIGRMQGNITYRLLSSVAAAAVHNGHAKGVPHNYKVR